MFTILVVALVVLQGTGKPGNEKRDGSGNKKGKRDSKNWLHAWIGLLVEILFTNISRDDSGLQITILQHSIVKIYHCKKKLVVSTTE